METKDIVIVACIATLLYTNRQPIRRATNKVATKIKDLTKDSLIKEID